MAEVYKYVRGMKLEKFIAKEPGVQTRLRDQAYQIADLASGILAEHRHAGHSRIEVERSPKQVDWDIVLSDERGQRAAIAIEYGRGEGAPNGPSRGVWALHLAAGLPLVRNKSRRG